MYTVLAIALVSLVSQSLATIDCYGDLVVYRCDYYKNDYGDTNKRTCDYEYGDPSNSYDCKYEPVICACRYGHYLVDVHGDKCLSKCDTTPPTINCPDLYPDAPSDGVDVNVEYDEITCEDESGYADLSCEPETDSTFTLGQPAKTVECWCIDGAQNVADCAFTVTVVDKTDPVIKCNDDITVSAGRRGTANVKYSTSCTDNSGKTTTTCDPISPAVFEVGNHAVECWCEDEAKNKDHCTIYVVVEDKTPPKITCVNPAPFTAGPPDYEANVSWDDPTCTDSSDSDPDVVCSDSPGFRFLGEYTIPCTCTDEDENQDSCDIQAVVQGEPHLICAPDDVTAFHVDIHDPYSPVDILGELRLPNEGTYKVTITVETTGTTPGKDLKCDYDITVEDH